jgi:hypothetical protein
MTNIQTALASAQTYQALYLIAKEAQPHLSFWGARYVTVKGYEGILPLDAFVKRVSEMVIQNPGYELNNQNLEIRAVVGIAIDNIYDVSDLQVKTASCFTRFLTKLRYFRLSGAFTPFRWHWRECDINRYTPLRESLTEVRIIPSDLVSIQAYSTEPAERSFWGQLYEDWRWL